MYKGRLKGGCEEKRGDRVKIKAKWKAKGCCCTGDLSGS
jgi:hypothetical protein